ncbi:MULTISPECIES: hypothetical protein [unclassified Gemella]|uniref:hypothetical protein n=1 Tax=unclassified Gemella TaxID=2624949 RepID=UPI0010734BCE|nr:MULTISPECIES: hypothetical protein [unclassified Gemella]MBF0710164.1 hypothetical protein [Gemella sp. GL1.1]MBF0746465.1 hypothetical protein [Gemella sp. 19428wG2_WT2a]NYS27508.1 hypothetical protein [Gemella sp. GL1]TFU60245.1 hypothetical protein E4T67_02050 [Gemella sp. WT2a]
MKLYTLTFKNKNSKKITLAGFDIKRIFESYAVDYDNLEVENFIAENYEENFYDVITDDELVRYLEKMSGDLDLVIGEDYNEFCNREELSKFTEEEKKALYFEHILNYEDLLLSKFLEQIESLMDDENITNLQDFINYGNMHSELKYYEFDDKHKALYIID